MPFKPHPWNVPTNFALQHLLIQLLFPKIASWSLQLSANLSFISQHVFFTTSIIFFLSISAISKACWNSPYILTYILLLPLFSSYLYPLSQKHAETHHTFCMNRQCSFFISTKTIFDSFSSILNVTFLFSSLLDHVFDTHNSFSRQKSNKILPFKFHWSTSNLPWTLSNL